MPYTYHIFHKPTNQHYYGARWAKGCSPDDLWETYFTSSKIVHDLIERYGANSFEINIRKIFNNIDKCKNWERRVLKRLNVCNNPKWINQSYGVPPVFIGNRCGQGLGRILSEDHKLAISKGNKGKKRTKQQCIDISKRQSNRPRNPHTDKTKIKMSSSSRKHQKQYLFKLDTIEYIGTLSDWADKYKCNKYSAATRFCNKLSYKKWIRYGLF